MTNQTSWETLVEQVESNIKTLKTKSLSASEEESICSSIESALEELKTLAE